MPEYLAPGVYIEETSYRAKSIEGVATSTTGFVGQCLWGPTQGPAKLVTSFEEFARNFGGLTAPSHSDQNYLAHAARAYFENGGKRLYVARVFVPTTGDGHAFVHLNEAGTFSFRARYPGSYGTNLTVAISGSRSGNMLRPPKLSGGNLVEPAQLSPGLQHGDIVEVSTDTRLERWVPGSETHPAPIVDNLREVHVNDQGARSLHPLGGGAAMTEFPAVVQKVTLTLQVTGQGRGEAYAGLSTHPESSFFLGTILRAVDPPDPGLRVLFTTQGSFIASQQATLWGLLLSSNTRVLKNGNDGQKMNANQLEGLAEGGIPTSGNSARGLAALEEVEDIAIVAAPGSGALDADAAASVRGKLLSHCERLRYRFAILSGGPDTNTAEAIRNVRAPVDSSYGALYYPWVRTLDPLGDGKKTILLPPEGYMAGIFARSDNERGVHKAPANEVVRGALDFSVAISKGTQEVLNPEGINCLRSFEGRGNRVWGARTLSSDPEWTYVNVRRLFIYLEHSIERATQWVVFEPNNEQLWKRVELTIESFLVDVWRTGALMGESPKEAFFVRCDRSTMTQGDLDNGRLVCLIGVAPTKPAEFVVFRIGQWTAAASIV